VGDKTICCVLLFACGHPAFPVDTHVQRVTRRLGWVPPGATAARCHTLLGELVPKDHCLSAHMNLIALGRSLCRPRAPRCAACPLRRTCRFAARTAGGVKRASRGGGRPGKRR
jgi:endonuclease-3